MPVSFECQNDGSSGRRTNFHCLDNDSLGRGISKPASFSMP